MLSIKQIIARFKQEETVTPELLLCMEGMQQRNAARIEAIKKEMGEKYSLHPSHKKSRLDEPRPV